MEIVGWPFIGVLGMAQTNCTILLFFCFFLNLYYVGPKSMYQQLAMPACKPKKIKMVVKPIKDSTALKFSKFRRM